VEGDLPGDGLDEVSNGLLSNQFVDSFAGTKDVAILDGISAGTSDSLIFPDIGLAQKLWVQVDLTNSDISKMRIELFAPGMATAYVLYDQSEKGTALSHKYNQDTPLASGDMNKDWQGKNLAGAWSLVVKDFSKNQSGSSDGKYNWSISIQTLSNKKVQAKGNLLVAGNVAATGSVGVGNDSSTCTAANLGALRFDPKWGLQACQKDIGSAVEYAWKAAKAAPIIWSGGCQSHNTSTGWNTYCLDGSDFSTAGEYLTVNANGTVTMKHSGYYSIDFYAIQHGCGQQDINIVVNGTGRTYTHTINDSSSSQWVKHSASLKYPFKKGDTVYVQLYHAGCGNTYDWHSWNPNGAHSRLTVEYLGPLEN
ncbi:MAG: proprotein convertase P-domain-containing protein, partial [Deltaproteobacteria bacterium]|nr:proprotein convertase P-domain-containing protein [Deltaproteobacteria bacterium]